MSAISRCCWKPDSLSSNESDYSGSESSDDDRYQTNPTELGNDEDQEKDTGDAAQLSANNEYRLEYYMQQLEQFSKAVYTAEDYGKDTALLLNRVEQKLLQ